MTRRSRAAHLVLFLVALLALSRLVTGSFSIPTGQPALWLHSGLLTLILGYYWIEHYFTRPADVVINSLVVYVSISTLVDPPLGEWWTLLRYVSLALLAVSFLIVWAGSPAIAGADTSLVKRVAYLVVIRIGSSAALYSAVFLLALFSYFDLADPIPKWLVGFWTFVLAAKHLQLGELFSSIITAFRSRKETLVGHVEKISYPDLVSFDVADGGDCPRGTVIALSSSGAVTEQSPLGVTIAHRAGPSRLEADALLFDGRLLESAPDARTIVVRVDRSDAQTRRRLERTQLGRQVDEIVGFARRNSDISHVEFELRRDEHLERGDLVSTHGLSGTSVVYQLVNARLFEEASLEHGRRMFTVGEAQQLGCWSSASCGFVSHAWVAPENSPIVRHRPQHTIETDRQDILASVGSVPNSSYPANIRISDLVLFHTAILGVTGSGKSFLAFDLIDKCAAQDIKVVCLDVTGDYQRYLPDAILIPNAGAIGPFLDDRSKRIGIIEFSSSTRSPVKATEEATQKILTWCREHRTDDEILNPRAKVLLVMEEAHLLVPEWTSNPERSLQDTVNSTAQRILQARKYGLGAMIVAQRTANVTKSILNQCNTIFAFQAFDETGFDFMKNYMGLQYVQALPGLRQREGIVVGKASTSDSPLIVRFSDQDRTLNTAPMATFQPPDPAPPADAHAGQDDH